MDNYYVASPDLIDHTCQTRIVADFPPPPPPSPSLYSRIGRPYLGIWIILILLIVGLTLRGVWVHHERTKKDADPRRVADLNSTAPKVDL